MALVFPMLEQYLSVFMDKLISERTIWKTKADLVHLWNTGMIPNSVSSRVILMETDRMKKEEKQVEQAVIERIPEPVVRVEEPSTEQKSTRCTFIITRGEKQGEQCTATAKYGTSCPKHYKDKPKPVSVAPSPQLHASPLVDQKINTVTDMSTLDLKLKKKKITSIEWTQVGSHRVVKNTSVVINEKNSVMGYLEKGNLIQEQNSETLKVCKEHKIPFNTDTGMDE